MNQARSAVARKEQLQASAPEAFLLQAEERPQWDIQVEPVVDTQAELAAGIRAEPELGIPAELAGHILAGLVEGIRAGLVASSLQLLSIHSIVGVDSLVAGSIALKRVEGAAQRRRGMPRRES